nr:Ldh family oxidoreductase [Desulfitobacterium chlororespirans]
MLRAGGVPEHDAQIIASVIIDTSLNGLDTHGLSRLPQYLLSLRKGRINPSPQIKIQRHDALAVIDGDNGMGQLIAEGEYRRTIEYSFAVLFLFLFTIFLLLYMIRLLRNLL